MHIQANYSLQPHNTFNIDVKTQYYIEISNTHKSKVPSDYIRKQTLVNSERYITPELKEYEDKTLSRL